MAYVDMTQYSYGHTQVRPCVVMAYTALAYTDMTYVATAYVVTAYMIMVCIVNALCSYGIGYDAYVGMALCS